MENLNEYQIAILKAKARVTAQMFVDEFNEILDPSKTDWDSIAWQEDSSHLAFRDVLKRDKNLYEKAYSIYNAELIEETKRLILDI